VAVSMGKVPLLRGASECAAQGVASSLAPQNARVADWMEDRGEAEAHPHWPLLIDPQTGAELLWHTFCPIRPPCGLVARPGCWFS